MSLNIREELKQKAENCRKALKYLDGCTTLTYDNTVKANQIAGTRIPEFELRRVWEQSKFILPTDTDAGGVDFVRQTMRNSLIEAISLFEETAQKLGEK